MQNNMENIWKTYGKKKGKKCLPVADGCLPVRGRLAGWPAGWLAAGSAGRLAGWPAGRLDGWTAGGWLAGRLATQCFVKECIRPAEYALLQKSDGSVCAKCESTKTCFSRVYSAMAGIRSNKNAFGTNLNAFGQKSNVFSKKFKCIWPERPAPHKEGFPRILGGLGALSMKGLGCQPALRPRPHHSRLRQIYNLP